MAPDNLRAENLESYWGGDSYVFSLHLGSCQCEEDTALTDLVFDFVQDMELRTSLEGDYREMRTCVEQSCWKAAHVLAGSIIEALLVDYLASEPQPPASLMKMALGELIDECRKRGLITDRSAQLSTVVRGYRNFVHPAVIKRKQERVDEEGARMAMSLTSMIGREIMERRLNTYGRTAEQVIAKVRLDAGNDAVLNHLLKDVRPNEKEKLLLCALPEALQEVDMFDEAEGDLIKSYGSLFRVAWKMTCDDTKKRVVASYASIVRDRGSNEIRCYETTFFRSSMLKYAVEPDRDLIVDHLVGKFCRSKSANYLQTVEGIGRYIKVDHVSDLILALVTVASGKQYSDEDRERSLDILWTDFRDVNANTARVVRGQLTHFTSWARKTKRDALANLLAGVKLVNEEPDEYDPFADE